MPKEHRYAIISDIHANIEALDAVIADAKAQNVTEFICLGDIVGYNASPSECIKRVRDLNCKVICGNHDFYCFDSNVDLEDFQPEAALVIEWTRRQLSNEDVEWLSKLKMQENILGFTIVHSMLDAPARFRYVFNTIDATCNFNCQTTRVCFHGHTHVPCIFSQIGSDVFQLPATDGILDKGRYFINVGSVGQPRDGKPDACYAIYTATGLTNTKIEFRRVPYDVNSAMEKILDAKLPKHLADRLALGV